MIFHWHESAVFELQETALYYGNIETDLGEQFAASAEIAVAKIAAHPELFRKFAGQMRKANLEQFPYAIVYWLSSDVVHIVAVMHLHRKPGYWRKRLE